MRNLIEIQESIVMVQLQHQGYAFKLPIYGCTNRENKKGLAITLGFFGIANLITYRYLKYKKGQTSITKNLKYQKAFNEY
jgi:hypothetical protein